MLLSNLRYRSTFRPAALTSLLGAAFFTACVASPPGLSVAEVAGSAGSVELAQAGSDEVAASGSSQATAGGDAAGADAGTASGGTASGGTASGGDASGGDASGGDASGGNPETGGSAGAVGGGGAPEQGVGGTAGGTIEAKIAATCPFHSDAVVGGSGGDANGGGGSGGAGGTGGAGGSGGTGPALTVTLQVSPFVGGYLADAAGRALYFYGADLPGDCHTPPVSQCVADCLLSWPLFPAGARVLAPGLDDGAFGAILRGDGLWQTTYNGWPLYYYKSDLTLGQVSGQGKGKTWHLAQQRMPGVVILSKTGSPKYLADGAGHTLYVSSADQAGGVDKDPVSGCSSTCRSTFEPFHEQTFSVVTSLAAADFAAFVPSGTGTLQVTYKGMPLYRAATDLKSGDMTGTASAGFTAATP